MIQLSARILRALRNLADKAQGRPVDWINIADARELTELGLAVRTRQGWSISPVGEARLAEDAGAEPAPPVPVAAFTRLGATAPKDLPHHSEE